MAACRRNAEWSAYGWQCDMIGIPAVRHSDTGPVKKSPYELLYIDTAFNMQCVGQLSDEIAGAGVMWNYEYNLV